MRICLHVCFRDRFELSSLRNENLSCAQMPAISFPPQERYILFVARIKTSQMFDLNIFNISIFNCPIARYGIRAQTAENERKRSVTDPQGCLYL